MGENTSNLRNRYLSGESNMTTDYGWKFQEKKLLMHADNSIISTDAEIEMHSILKETCQSFADLDNCLQCGICTSVCPGTMVLNEAERTPRELIQLLRLGLLDLSGPELWSCTNCGACTTNCPSQVPIVDAVINLRTLVYSQRVGYIPDTIKSALSSIRTFKNPWRQPVKNRSAWLDEIDVQPRQTLESILLFTGCSPAYSPRNQNIAKAAAQLLDRMQVAFTTLGRKEVCCGDLALRAGDLKTFNKLKKTNQTGIADSKAQYVYTLSPHCFHTMQTSYFKENETRPALRPFILLLYDKLKSGALCFSRKIRKKVTYHDPCFLGRYNNIYDAPREIMESIEGLSLIEMKHNRQNSICCGGGGGGMCLDRESGERLGEIRLNEALAVNAEVVVTACPHCLTMLEDAAQSHPKYQDLKIMDVCELALQAV